MSCLSRRHRREYATKTGYCPARLLLSWPAPVALDAALLEEMVQVAFSQRRKLLRHTLGRWLEGRGFSGAFDVQRRAEEVPVAEYVSLAQAAVSG